MALNVDTPFLMIIYGREQGKRYGLTGRKTACNRERYGTSLDSGRRPNISGRPPVYLRAPALISASGRPNPFFNPYKLCSVLLSIFKFTVKSGKSPQFIAGFLCLEKLSVNIFYLFNINSFFLSVFACSQDGYGSL